LNGLAISGSPAVTEGAGLAVSVGAAAVTGLLDRVDSGAGEAAGLIANWFNCGIFKGFRLALLKVALHFVPEAIVDKHLLGRNLG